MPQLPTARFAMVPSAGSAPLQVTFDASSSSSPNGTIVMYAWNFGDGSTGSGMSAAHTYSVSVETTFLVTLSITDSTGAQAASSAAIHVAPPSLQPETAAVGFTWPFHFDASGEDDVNLNDEYFTLINTGERAVDLSGWSVETEDGRRYEIPSGFALLPGAVVTIHSGCGVDSQSVLFWRSTGPVWNNLSGLAVLRDASGTIIDVYPYFSC